MARKTGLKKNSKKTPKNGEKRTNTATRLLKSQVVQDLVAGFSLGEIAERHNISKNYASVIQKERREEIDKEILEKAEIRQQKINKFIEDESDLMIRVCQQTAELLELSLKKQLDKAKNQEAVTVEVRKKQKTGEYVRAVPADCLETALRAYRDIRATLAMLQQASVKDADQVQ